MSTITLAATLSLMELIGNRDLLVDREVRMVPAKAYQQDRTFFLNVTFKKL